MKANTLKAGLGAKELTMKDVDEILDTMWGQCGPKTFEQNLEHFKSLPAKQQEYIFCRLISDRTALYRFIQTAITE